jgi:hypothetical protein
MIPVAYVEHALAGRIRLKVPSERGNADYFDRVGRDLAEFPGINRIKVSSRTGSLLLLYDEHNEPISRITAFARDRQLFIVEDCRSPWRSPLEQAAEQWSQLDNAITRFSLGALDTRSLVFMILLIASALQIFRGQILAPASTLLWYVLELLLNGRTRADQ